MVKMYLLQFHKVKSKERIKRRNVMYRWATAHSVSLAAEWSWHETFWQRLISTCHRFCWRCDCCCDRRVCSGGESTFRFLAQLHEIWKLVAFDLILPGCQPCLLHGFPRLLGWGWCCSQELPSLLAEFQPGSKSACCSWHTSHVLRQKSCRGVTHHRCRFHKICRRMRST